MLFCATVREMFTDELMQKDFVKTHLSGWTEALGTARAQLAIDPQVAWNLLLDVRARLGYSPPGRTAEV